MKILKEGQVKIFSSAKEMPIGRYADFQKYLSANSDPVQGLQRVKAFIQEGRNEDAITEIDNAIQASNEAKNSVGILSYPFAVLVAEISGKVVNDTTIDGLNRTVELLTEIGISQEDCDNAVEEVKKK